MPSDLSGVPLADPDALYRTFVEKGCPVGRWAGVCNSFASPAEREPGTAHLLVFKSDWDRIPDKTSLTLAFQDAAGVRVAFPKLHVVSGPTPLPRAYNDPADPILWLTLEDRRSRFRQVAVGESYNLRAADGTWVTATLNAGTAYTWAEVVADLWAKLKAVYADLPSTPPALPSTPSGTPESFDFDAENAWDALCVVAQAAGFLVKYDPTADTGGDGPVTVIDPAPNPDPEPTATKAARTWDTAAFVAMPEAVPASVTVSYRRVGRGERHNVSAAITEDGTTAGASVVLPAYPAAAGDPVSNTTYLTAFAERVRDFWRRDVEARAEPRSVQYRGYQSWCKGAVGLRGYAAWGVSELRADEVQTSLVSGPLLRLDTGEAWLGAATTASSALNTQNTDGTQVDATTTDIRFNKTTGVQVTQGSGGTAGQSLVTGIDASHTQTGMMNTTFQRVGGSKQVVGNAVILSLDSALTTSTYSTDDEVAYFKIGPDPYGSNSVISRVRNVVTSGSTTTTSSAESNAYGTAGICLVSCYSKVDNFGVTVRFASAFNYADAQSPDGLGVGVYSVREVGGSGSLDEFMVGAGTGTNGQTGVSAVLHGMSFFASRTSWSGRSGWRPHIYADFSEWTGGTPSGNGPIRCRSDFYFDDIGEGPCVRSPNGNRWRLGVDNAGALTITGPL